VSVRNEIAAIARLDWADVVRSRWLFVCLGLYGLLAGVFVLVGLRESSVVGFTGMGRVLFSFSHALVLLLPLVALVVTGQVINRARDDGALELFLAQPVRRSSYLIAIALVRYLALVAPLLALFFALAVLGSVLLGQVIPWSFLARCAALCAVLLWAFSALGLATSVLVRSPARAMTYLILFWLAGVALLDFGLIGLMLTWRLNPQTVFLLAALNPVEAVRLALLSAAEPDLATLGPVGFYLSTRLGPDMLLTLGIAWPFAFGALAWTIALSAFRRNDIV
jgi:ABC-type transport system involved in multi-copper enzyme maturation permease subunit